MQIQQFDLSGPQWTKKSVKLSVFFYLTFTDVHMDSQKSGTILENKVELSKNDNIKKPSSKLIFFNEKKSERFK